MELSPKYDSFIALYIWAIDILQRGLWLRFQITEIHHGSPSYKWVLRQKLTGHVTMSVI